MKSGRVLLEMLKKYEVEVVFGLPGETTLPLYEEWKTFEGIEHVMVRDERNSVFMADGYAKISGKPGVCEGPSVGAPHMLPGVIEAYSSCVPLIVFTTDIPLNYEKRNMLTGANQTAIFEPFVKESLVVSKGTDIPYMIRRAFRLATTGRPGPVHLRLPMDMLKEDVSVCDLYAQPGFSTYPGRRSQADSGDIDKAIRILAASKRGVVICGQGVLHSRAWNEVARLAERFELAVGTTINGKGSIAETHPLSIGTVGARGATSFSNALVAHADCYFFIGSSTDSAGTDGWKVPALDTDKPVIQLDASENELGNNYPAAVLLLGDAQSTLKALLERAGEEKKEKGFAREIAEKKKAYLATLDEGYEDSSFPIHPMRLVAELEKVVPENALYAVDPGISAVYPGSFMKANRPGRTFVCNFAQGSLGYATSAALGVAKAAPGQCVVNITGDGSFGFCAGEFETIARTGANIKIILINNKSFGWIRVTNSLKYNNEAFATDFSDVDYLKTVEGMGIPAFRVTSSEELSETLVRAFATEGPVFVEIPSEPEDLCIPPVPGWAEKARERGQKNYF